MGLLSYIAEKREQQVLDRARPHLGDDEEVLSWVRARDPEDGRRGLFFITHERVLVAWSGRKADAAHVLWAEVRAWGINDERSGGPVLCIENQDGELTFVQMVVDTPAMARVASRFIATLAELAPEPESARIHNSNGSFFPESGRELNHRKRTPREMAKRIGLTVLGAGLIVVGIVIIPLPGPWSFLLNIAGLAVLAQEYDWAEDLLQWTKERFEAAKKKVAERKRRRGKA